MSSPPQVLLNIHFSFFSLLLNVRQYTTGSRETQEMECNGIVTEKQQRERVILTHPRNENVTKLLQMEMLRNCYNWKWIMPQAAPGADRPRSQERERFSERLKRYF